MSPTTRLFLIFHLNPILAASGRARRDVISVEE